MNVGETQLKLGFSCWNCACCGWVLTPSWIQVLDLVVHPLMAPHSATALWAQVQGEGMVQFRSFQNELTSDYNNAQHIFLYI